MILVQRTALPRTTDVLTEFPGWIAEFCMPTWAILDIGAGRDIHKTATHLRPHVARMVGVDPADDILENISLDACHQKTLEDFAQDREQQAVFDCAYSVMVLEHVKQPLMFLSACHAVLKPGGMLFGVTPNLWHYFGMTTKICGSLGIEDLVLERLVGPQTKASYHFPTAYRCNSIRAISHALSETGFQSIEFRCFDPAERLQFYFPRPFKWIPHVYSHAVHATRWTRFMGYLMFRATA